jgi:enoyl-CoA hydratase/carnithine racemase
MSAFGVEMVELKGRRTNDFRFEEILYVKDEFLATVTFNRPQVYNAYSTRTLTELIAAFQDASWDDSIAVVVLTGAGTKAFCTGGDVAEYDDKFIEKPHDYWKWMGLFQGALDALRNIGKPVIARLNGIVVGGGNEFNLACDLAVMAEHAYIKQVGPQVGSVPCGGATQWLPITIGDRRAREMLYLCEEVYAQDAYRWGLVNRIVPSIKNGNGKFLRPPDVQSLKEALKNPNYQIDLCVLDQEVKALAEKLVEKFPECLRYTKQQVNYWKDLAWHSTIGHGREWLSLHFATREPLEGMGAFVEKRKVDYKKLRRIAAEGGAPDYVYGPPKKTCASCGAKNLPASFEFCGKCGVKL